VRCAKPVTHIFRGPKPHRDNFSGGLPAIQGRRRGAIVLASKGRHRAGAVALQLCRVWRRVLLDLAQNDSTETFGPDRRGVLARRLPGRRSCQLGGGAFGTTKAFCGWRRPGHTREIPFIGAFAYQGGLIPRCFFSGGPKQFHGCLVERRFVGPARTAAHGAGLSMGLAHASNAFAPRAHRSWSMYVCRVTMAPLLVRDAGRLSFVQHYHPPPPRAIARPRFLTTRLAKGRGPTIPPSVAHCRLYRGSDHPGSPRRGCLFRAGAFSEDFVFFSGLTALRIILRVADQTTSLDDEGPRYD